MEAPITAVSMSITSHRAHYYTRASVSDDAVPRGSGGGSRWKHCRWPVMAWAAQGGALWPVRLEERTGRGVLCGTAGDPLREDFLGVLTAGSSLAELGDEVDLLIRERNLEDADDADED